SPGTRRAASRPASPPLPVARATGRRSALQGGRALAPLRRDGYTWVWFSLGAVARTMVGAAWRLREGGRMISRRAAAGAGGGGVAVLLAVLFSGGGGGRQVGAVPRSGEHTSGLQSLT